MDWSDESYVKLYTRDTVTWRSWPWEARAVWPSLMRKLDGAGLMPSGRLDMARAVAVMIEMPIEVVTVALDALLADGTIEKVAGGILAPKFLEAQEARKNDRLRAAEYRGRSRTIAKAMKPLDPPVTPRHTASLDVTGRHSPALPCPAPPRPFAGETPPAKTPSAHQDLIDALVVVFEVKRGSKYAFDGRDAKATAAILRLGDRPEAERRWRLALDLRYPTVDSIHQLPKAWNRCTGPPAATGKGPVDAATQNHTQTGWIENFGEQP